MSEIPPSKFVINLEGIPVAITPLLRYQDGAIVSREIYTKKPGSITIFSFDEGQGLSEHTAPFDAMIYMLEGTAKITIGHKDTEVKQDQFILMPANVPHAVKAISKFKMMLIMIRG
jgi:quercetin dioxygenase-like cupin family protein